MSESIADKNVTTSELSLVLGITSRRIQQLVKEGVIPALGRGLFRLCEAVQSYNKFLQSGSSTTSATGLNFKDEKTMLTKVQREQAEIELAKLRRTVHSGEDVKTALLPVLAALKSRILSVPTKAAVQLIDKSDVTEIQIVIRKEIHEALREITNIDPAELILQEVEAKAREKPDGSRKNLT